jgi:hypothetical protein
VGISPDVEEDGSAHFEVPANLPLYFLPLDAEGRAVQRMRTFTHFMPGERQSCVGCHSDRNYAPSPTHYTAASIAIHARRRNLKNPTGETTGSASPRSSNRCSTRHCVSCHDQSDLDLSGDRTDYFNVAYENLARRGTQAEHGGDARGGMAAFGRNPYTSWIPTYNGCESNILEIEPKTWGSPVSPLADLVINGHPDEKGEKRIDLTDDERLRILMWIDLNVPYYGTSQSRQPTCADAGRSFRRISMPCSTRFPNDVDSTCRGRFSSAWKTRSTTRSSQFPWHAVISHRPKIPITNASSNVSRTCPPRWSSASTWITARSSARNAGNERRRGHKPVGGC